MIERPLRWNARSLALSVLLQARKKEAFVQDLLESAFRDVPLSAADRGLATQLVYGVFRRRGKVWRKPFDFRHGDTYTTKLLPGFRLVLDPNRR